MKVLITGGTGFIGSHLCDYYIKHGQDVTVIDNLSTGSISNIKNNIQNIDLIEGNITDVGLVNDLVSKSDLVLHLAAAVGVKTILAKPIESITTNFLGSETILNACAKHDKRLLIASTSEIYGKNEIQPLSETDDRVVGPPQILRWSYADAKALEESLAHALYLSKKLKVTTVRFFNTVGPRQSSQYGMVLPNFIEMAIRNEPILVHGNGQQTRVFCHVLDAIEAVTMLIKTNSSIGEVFNIGGNEEISILNLAHRVKKLLNSKSPIVHQTYNEAYGDGFEDINKRIPNLTKIKKLIDWQPKIYLDQIIKDIHQSKI
jgi:UDP-glucose 4-epimerase